LNEPTAPLYTCFTEDLQGFTAVPLQSEFNQDVPSPVLSSNAARKKISQNRSLRRREHLTMRTRNPKHAGKREDQGIASPQFSFPSPLGKQHRRGRERDALTPAASLRFRRVTPAVHPRNLGEDIHQLIELEAARIKKAHTFLGKRTRGEDAADETAFDFSSADFILQRLQQHTYISSAERQLLMCTIQAAGFALGIGSQSLESADFKRSRANHIAQILAEAIEKDDSLLMQPASFMGVRLPV
jgi:hypothetical protein